MHLGSWAIDDVLTFTAQTFSPTTNEPADADGAPTYRVYEDETTAPILTGTMAALDAANTDGFYSEQITLSAANGLESGKSYTIRIFATVGGVDGALIHTFQVGAKVNAGDGSGFTDIPWNAAEWDTPAENAATAALVAADLATEAEIADAIWDEARAGHVAAGSFGEYTNAKLIDGDHGGASASLTLSSATITGILAIDQADITTMNLFDVVVSSNFAISGALSAATNNLPWNANWDAEVQSEVSDELTLRGYSATVAGRIDAAVSTRASQTSVDDVPTNAELAAAIITGLTTALTEGYRGTGATGSVRDMLYEIIGHMGESAIVGTTKTIKKLDGTTPAKTYTLNSTTPSSISETT